MTANASLDRSVRMAPPEHGNTSVGGQVVDMVCMPEILYGVISQAS